MKYLYRIIILSFFMNLISCSSGADDFKLCGLGIKMPYYFTNLKYKNGMYAIKKSYKEKYKPVKNGVNSGIIKIRFDVNCKGETGNFKFDSYDLNYQLVTLDESIVHQTIQIAKELDDWIPGINDENETVNSFKFIALRLVEGEIIEILPK